MESNIYDYSRCKPIPHRMIIDGKRVTFQTAVIKFPFEELEATRKIGRFYIPENYVKRGFHCLESGIVVAVSDGETQIKKGDRVLTSYSLISIDRSNDGKDLRHNRFLGQDEHGNEYVCPTIDKWSVYGIVRDGDEIEPLNGHIYCDPPPPNDSLKSDWIYIPEEYRKMENEKKPFRLKIKFISPDDSKKTGLKKGDMVIGIKNSYMEVKDRNDLVRIPIEYVVGKIQN